MNINKLYNGDFQINSKYDANFQNYKGITRMLSLDETSEYETTPRASKLLLDTSIKLSIQVASPAKSLASQTSSHPTPSPIKYTRARHPSTTSTLRQLKLTSGSTQLNADNTDTQTVCTRLTSYDYIPGVEFNYFQGEFDEIPEFEHLDYSTGCIRTIQIDQTTEKEIFIRKEPYEDTNDLNRRDSRDATVEVDVLHSNQLEIEKNITEILEDKTLLTTTENGNFAVKMSGFIRIPQNGLYTFYLGSNDGSILYLSSKKLIDNSGKVKI